MRLSSVHIYFLFSPHRASLGIYLKPQNKVKAQFSFIQICIDINFQVHMSIL